MKHKRLKITEQVGKFGNLSQSLDRFINELRTLAEKYKEYNYPENQLYIENTYNYGNCYYESDPPTLELIVTRTREETDKEFEKRTKVK